MIIKQLKSISSIQLREKFPKFANLGYLGSWKQFKNLQSRGYYYRSAKHASQDAVKRYILEQEAKDVFNYSIYGDRTGYTKIGDFIN